MDATEAKLFGTDLFGESLAPKAKGKLAERFIVPPFSVLNAREGEWQDRKRAWVELGIKGQLGRDDVQGPDAAIRTSMYCRDDDGNEKRGGKSAKSGGKHFGVEDGKTRRSGGLGHDGTRDGVLGINKAAQTMAKYNGKEVNETLDASTSIFDPVLAELMFRWFCPTDGLVLDPFGGESTKGIVATVLGLRYFGIEVRQEQVNANNEQAKAAGVTPQWICGDSAKADDILPPDLAADFIFTSPPYFDLEIYSEDINDGSAFSSYKLFMDWYKDIFRQCILRLRPSRFLAVKVGEIRDERGIYRNFVGDNITCFKDLGLHYYNEIILVTSAGSLPIRAGKQFSVGRKIGKTHQNILVFFKGNPDRIEKEFPALE